MSLVLFMLTGVIAGFAAGLLGIGGGSIIVPASLLIFAAFPDLGIEQRFAMQMAIATSLATIPFTGISAVYRHLQLGRVNWPLVMMLSPGIILGSLFGAPLAEYMGGLILEKIFGVFQIVVGVQLLLASGQDFRKKTKAKSESPHMPKLLGGLSGFCIGILSSLLGIGGGSITVPFLAWRKFKMQEAIAVSSTLGVLLAIVASLSFAFTGLQETSDIAFAYGYVFLPGVLAILSMSLICSRLGVNLTYKVSSTRLKTVFSVYSLGIGIMFIV